MAKAKGEEVVRVGAVADLHYSKTSQGALQGLFEEASRRADVLLLAGDLTDFGLPEEAQALAKDLRASVKVPVVAVLGNHDFESGKQAEVANILCEAGIHVLDGESVEVRGVGIAGVKGFIGGFGRATLEAWGEGTIKRVVRESLDEVLKLERALARLGTGQRIALLHYAPIQATVEGEPVEIFAFMGCGRLEEPLNRFNVSAAVHGHAHRGYPEGKTSGGVPVYNVALPLLRRTFAGAPPLRVIELPVTPRTEEPSPAVRSAV